jgi:hypothetical protein
MRYAAAVEQVPRHAIGGNAPAADETGIEEVETLVAGIDDLPVRVGDQDLR